MEMKCKNCIHWEREKESYKDKRFGDCNHDKFVDVSNGRDIENYENDSVLFSDYDSYAANLKTGENFGCIHFKNKE